MTKIIESLNITASPYINAILSFAVFLAIAKLADLFVGRVLGKFTKFTKSDIDDKILAVVHRPVFFTIIAVGLVHTVSYLGPAPKLFFYISAILYSMITFLWMTSSIKISNIIIEDAIYKVSDVTGLSKDVIPLIENLSKIVIVIASLMVILSIWKINITPLLASAGIAGAGIALAAKDTIANFFGGISVFTDKPFKIGDFIVLDKGERGEVVTIGIRSTRIKTLDDVMITIPNSVLINSKIVNESAPTPNLRIKTSIGVAYGSDIELVEKALLEVASGNENLLADPAPKVWFMSFGESSLNFDLLCWIKDPTLRLRATDSLNRAIYKRFNELGIKVPFPQRDVHIYKEIS